MPDRILYRANAKNPVSRLTLLFFRVAKAPEAAETDTAGSIPRTDL